MQAALTLSIAPTLLPLTTLKNLSQLSTSFPSKLIASSSSRCPATKAATAEAYDSLVVDYSSVFSVFPAEACETVGGEACEAYMYPEVNIRTEYKNDISTVASDDIDREYLDYTQTKTVFLGEACDDLGGEFCGLEYQKGVF